MRGKFIAIYGINNIGKTTQSKRLVERLEKEGHKAKYLKYPIYDLEPTGPFLNETLRGGADGADAVGVASGASGQKISEDELQLWFVLNRYQFEPELKRLLAEGYIVIAEDYTGTGIAWGTAKGLDQKWLEEANKYLLKEDFAILMQGKRDVSAKEKNHLHEQNEELVAKCTEVLNGLADKYGWRRVEVQENWDETTELLWDQVKKVL